MRWRDALYAPRGFSGEPPRQSHLLLAGAPLIRAAITIREATADDVPVLLDMWTELRHHGVRRSARPSSDQLLAEVAHRYVQTIADSSCRLVVAAAGDDAVGMGLFTVVSSSTLLDVPTIQVSHLYVAGGHRRRGVGKAIIAAAATYADECGIDQVMASVTPGLRDLSLIHI